MANPYRVERVDPKDRARLDENPVKLSRVLSLFRGHGPALTIVTAIIVASSVVGLGQPFLVRSIVDDAIPNQDVTLLAWSVAAMIALAVITQVLGVVQTWISSTIGQRVMHSLRTDVFAHLQRQSLNFFIRSRAGEVQSRIVNDIGGLKDVVTTTATSIASNLTTTVATAAAMLVLSWRLSLLTLIVLPPAIWLTRRVAMIRRTVTREQQQLLADMNTQVEEGLSVSGIRLSKTIGASAHNAARFAETSERLIGLELRSQLAGRWQMATMQVVFAAIPAVIYLVAGMPATSGPMTIGTLVAFTALQASIFRPLMGLLNVSAQVISSMALFSRVFEYLDLVPDVPAPAHPVRIEKPRGEVTLRGVSFRYPGADRDALSHINVTVRPGGSLAVVGHTGSGKSTLATLVSRLYDPTSGSIMIDGVDLREIDPEQLTELVGIVSQETYLVHSTIRENLLLARRDADEATLWGALEAAQISELVASLPEGLDTVVGARGYRFSGGEQQRLAVARTILRNPPILVLDEATSALDNVTEAALQAALDQLVVGRTTLTIAHRLSTIENSDEVLVLEKGRVVERGRPEELREADGAFATLANVREAA